MSKETLKLYSAKLSSFDPRDVQEAVGKLAMEERREGETSFPALATIVSRVEAARVRRRRAEVVESEKEEDERNFWAWVDERLQDTGKDEQSFLDSLRIPGYTGLRAR
jgi:hypothetical protein